MATADNVSCGDDAFDAPAAVLAAALQAYVAVNGDGRVAAWNPAATSTFGYPQQEACGRLIHELIIPERFREAHRAGLAQVMAGGPGRVLGKRLQLTALHRDGHEFPVELALTMTDTAAGRRFHAFAHDITAAQRASRYASVEAAVSRGLAESTCSAAAAVRVAEAVGTRMQWPVSEVWLVDEARQVVWCAGRHVAAGYVLGRFAFDELELGIGLPGTVCATGAPRWIPDLAADTASVRSRAAARIGLHVAVGVPIKTGHVLGALCVYGDRVEDPQDALLGLLSGLAAHVGQFVERRRAEELMVELARTKDEFVALVTHELRNPLAIITTTAELAEEELGCLSVQQQRAYLRTIARSAQRLTTLAGDLLDLARLESGNLAITLGPTNLCEVITDATTAIADAAHRKNLTLDVRLPASPLLLQADSDRLRQVADNLLSNATKYTPHGGTITVTAHGDASQVTWMVADTGIGVPAEERPKLFRRFYRASTALDRHIPGTGLGLVITRTIIERHGGTITLTDHPGPGTIFTIHLPTKPPPIGEPATATHGGAESSASP
jgi:PAS domain S-box-containing protein